MEISAGLSWEQSTGGRDSSPRKDFKHIAGAAMERLRSKNDNNAPECPSQRRELNPIRNLWQRFKDDRDTQCPSSLNEQNRVKCSRLPSSVCGQMRKVPWTLPD